MRQSAAPSADSLLRFVHHATSPNLITIKTFVLFWLDDIKTTVRCKAKSRTIVYL
jgi:hypothetical protein